MKRIRYVVFLLFLSLFFNAAVAQEYKPDKRTVLKNLFLDQGEIYFTFNIENNKDIALLTKIISIDQIIGNRVYAYASMNEFSRFFDLGYHYKVLIPPGKLIVPEMLDDVEELIWRDWDFYPTYEVYTELMYQFQSDHPDICKIYNIGTLASGRELLVARISDNPEFREPEPQFLYTSTMHGDEVTGYVLMLHLVDYLLNNYTSDPRIYDLINSIDIWINPLANPDGTYAGGNQTVYGATRYNANNVDLNRNFPDPEEGPHPDGNPWQPETIAFMEFAEEHDFVMSANFHGGAELVNYPWDTWQDRHADDNWWIYVSYEYADTVHANSSGYFYGQGTGVSNGWDWYTISGGRQDYMNYFHYCREATIELSDTKILPANQLPDYWEYNYRSFINYMNQCLYGVTGITTDSLTGEPLPAKVWIEGHDKDNSEIYAALENGNYHRLIYEGDYNITFKKEGYYPKVFTVLLNAMYTTVELDVQLVPGNLVADFHAISTIIATGNETDFIDESYGDIQTWAWTFEGGSPSASNQQNPSVIYDSPGTYSVTLTVSDGTQNNSILKTDYITVNEEYTMSGSTIHTCGGLFLDSGGSQNNYSNNEHSTMTFYPDEPGSNLIFTFLAFNVEYQSVCDYDWLKIYNGPGTNSPLIGTWCGTDSPGVIESTDPSGAVTFQFHSDGNVTASGWRAEITCDSNVGGILNSPDKLYTVYPLPADNWLVIEINHAGKTGNQSLDIQLFDITGRNLPVQYQREETSKLHYSIDVGDLTPGLYYIRLYNGEQSITYKILIY